MEISSSHSIFYQSCDAGNGTVRPEMSCRWILNLTETQLEPIKAEKEDRNPKSAAKDVAHSIGNAGEMEKLEFRGSSPWRRGRTAARGCRGAATAAAAAGSRRPSPSARPDAATSPDSRSPCRLNDNKTKKRFVHREREKRAPSLHLVWIRSRVVAFSKYEDKRKNFGFYWFSSTFLRWIRLGQVGFC